MLNALASVIAWAIALGITLGLLGLLVWLLRVILRDSVGKPGLRALLLTAFALALILLWSASQAVP